MATIKLKNPITVSGATVTSIELRKCKVKDSIAARKSSPDVADQEIALIAILANLAPSDIEELDMSDYKQVQKVLQGFLS